MARQWVEGHSHFPFSLCLISVTLHSSRNVTPFIWVISLSLGLKMFNRPDTFRCDNFDNHLMSLSSSPPHPHTKREGGKKGLIIPPHLHPKRRYRHGVGGWSARRPETVPKLLLCGGGGGNELSHLFLRHIATPLFTPLDLLPSHSSSPNLKW